MIRIEIQVQLLNIVGRQAGSVNAIISEWKKKQKQNTPKWKK